MTELSQMEPDTSGGDDAEPVARDFDAEARKHGWRPKEEFKGDPNRWTDAETFVKRADEVMPLLQKQNEGLKRELDEMKRTLKQASKHFEASEQRAYQRALSELEAKHDAAVEVGDVAGARRVVAEMKALPTPDVAMVADDAPSQDQLRSELNAWVEANDWYVLDDAKRRYADLQADMMGTADKWDGGQKAWLAELENRVAKKFAAKDEPREAKTPLANGGGNRPSSRGGKTYADLPPDAKRMCDKFVKNGIVKDRDAYVKSYDFG